MKGDTRIDKDDWYYRDFICNMDFFDSGDKLDRCNYALENNTSIDLDFWCHERNSEYNSEQLFAVYEKQDLVGLIEVLQESLDEAQ